MRVLDTIERAGVITTVVVPDTRNYPRYQIQTSLVGVEVYLQREGGGQVYGPCGIPRLLMPFVFEALSDRRVDTRPASPFGLDSVQEPVLTAWAEHPLEYEELVGNLEVRIQGAMEDGVLLGHYFDGEWIGPLDRLWAWATYRDIVENHPSSLTPGERVWRRMDDPEVGSRVAVQARLTGAILNIILPD